jgi:hypothetical protein
MGRRRNRPLKRGAPKREPRQRLLVLCEGKITEPLYLKAFKHERRSQLVKVEVVPECGVPKSLVEQAVERKKHAEKEARRRGDPYLKYDEVCAYLTLTTIQICRRQNSKRATTNCTSRFRILVLNSGSCCTLGSNMHIKSAVRFRRRFVNTWRILKRRSPTTEFNRIMRRQLREQTP